MTPTPRQVMVSSTAPTMVRMLLVMYSCPGGRPDIILAKCCFKGYASTLNLVRFVNKIFLTVKLKETEDVANKTRHLSTAMLLMLLRMMVRMT